ncbi:ATP-binding cassette domain-containing protein [Gemella cuniculi]|nr:ATP-binding cassette domain-containing protein [Gemella cuniculi]
MSFLENVIGYLPQEVDSETLRISSFEYFKSEFEDDINYSLLYSLLENFNLEDYFFEKDITIGEMSGGEKIKFFLICILLKEPDLLLLDEPSNNLDVKSIEWLEKFIKASKVAIIFVSHDERLISNCANVIVHFEQLKKKTEFSYNVERMNYSEYSELRAERIVSKTKKAKKEKQLFNKKEENYRNVYQKVHHALNQEVRNPTVAKNLKDKMKSLKSQEKRLEKEKEGLTTLPDYEGEIFIKFPKLEVIKGKNILSVKINNLSNNKVLLENSFFQIKSGEKIFIVGDNGCGKTTLLKYITNSLKEEKIEYGYMPQNYEEILKNYKTPSEFLGEGLSDKNKIFTYLGSVNLTHEEMIRDIKTLSGGQKAKVFLTKLILQKSEILILDEPTRNLSVMSLKVLAKQLAEFSGTIIAVCHDRDFIEKIASKIYYFENKKLKEKVINKKGKKFE